MAKRSPRRGPKNTALPGMSDSAIKPLEEAAEAYADIRDQRQALNQDEAKLKASVLSLMKKHGKTVYQRNGITITVVAEEETVKVRVRKASDDDEDAGDE